MPLSFSKAEINASYSLYSKEEIKNLLVYKNNIRVATQMVVYQKNGVEYPVYCLNRDNPGITMERSYIVTCSEEIKNNTIWRAIINGYPYKSVEELGCANIEEAYVATKMAVYDILYNYNYDDFTPVGEAGTRVLNAMKRISTEARNSNQVKKTASIKINEKDKEWKIEDNYIVKNYDVDISASAQSYEVHLKGKSLNGIKVTNKNDIEKEKFSINEGFKVKIPIAQCTQDGTFDIEVSCKQMTNPILHGIAPSVDLQDYAISAERYEDTVESLKVEYTKNKTRIKILKIDGETLETLSNVEFSLLDEKKNEVKKDLVTDQKGEIVVENILPGKYYLNEVKKVEGYEDNYELFEVNVEFNEEKEIVINNFKKKKIAENKEKIDVPVREEIKLPRTGK